MATPPFDPSSEPLGSFHPVVRKINSTNFDLAMHTTAKTWLDRFGLLRKTWAAIETEIEGLLVAGGKIFDTEEEGRAAADDGQYYFAASDDPDVSKMLFKRISESESEWIADDPSAEFVRGVAAASNAALEIASGPSRLDDGFFNDDEPDVAYRLMTALGRVLAEWGLDGYQIVPARGAFNNDDSPLFFAITDEKQNPLMAIDEYRQYIHQWREGFYNDDDTPDNCYVDKNDFIIMSWSNEGEFDLPGITAGAAPADYITAALSSADAYSGPKRLSEEVAIALSPASRLLNDWYYMDGVLLYRDDLPAYVPAEFSATPDIPSGDAQSVIAEEALNTVLITSNPANVSGFATRLLGFMVEGLEARTPEFIIDNRSSWNAARTLTRHRLVWSHDPDSDNWRTFDNRIDDEAENEWRFSNDAPFELDRIYLSHIPNYTYQRHINKTSEWTKNKLSGRTESGNAAYQLGTCSARTSFYLNKAIPATPQYAFKVGHGNKVVAMTSGIHTDEKPGLYMLEGAANLMLSNGALGRQMRETFTAYFYPAVNSQGLYAGAQRWEAENGDDCNRIWGGDTPSELRTIYEAAWESDLGDKDVIAVLDFHSSPASSPETQEARQLWYNTSNNNPADLLFVAKVREYFEIRTTGANSDNMIANYVGSTYGAKVRMTPEVNHDASLNVDDWKSYGALMLQALFEIKDQL